MHRDVSSVSVLVQRLHERRFVQKRPDPVDQRRLLLSATPRGRRLVQDAPDGAHMAPAVALADWPADRVQDATDLLRQLAAALHDGP